MNNPVSRPSISIYRDTRALESLEAREIEALTEAATASTYFHTDLTIEQIDANRRIVAISALTCADAARRSDQLLTCAFEKDRLAGFVIATRHDDNDCELDWLMVDPAYHGSGVAAVLMQAGIEWLGADKTIWLSVVSYNLRAIGFYRKFGFEVEAHATTSHIVPHLVMRRIANPAL